MTCDRWNGRARTLLLAVAVVGFVGFAGCGGSNDGDSAGGGAASKAAKSDAATAGPDEATKSAAIREVEQGLSALRQKANDLKKRAELDGVTENESVQQALTALDRQVADAQSKVGSLGSAAGEAWSTAESGAKSAVSAADQAASQLKARIDAARAAMRAEAIEAEKEMLSKGLVSGLNGEEYESYKRSVVEEVQQQLKEIGLYAGAVDGWLERSTKRAIAALQEQNGLEPTGLPTPKTRKVLRGEDPHAEEGEG